MRYFYLLVAILMWSRSACAQPTTAATQTVETNLRLWAGDAPGATGQTDFDIPTITLYRPPADKSTGAMMIVCPGGAYTHYGVQEGVPIAQWLNTLGITAGVLKYRLGSHGYRHPIEMQDVQRAIRTFRASAPGWNLDPNRVGIIGFSAGGHLASTAATHFDDGNPNDSDPVDRVSSRPDLAMLIYPVITMGKYTHAGSRKALLGDNPAPALIDLLSNEKQVTAKTPPCFLVHGDDDATVPVENSIEFTLACRQNHVPVELHIFEHGRHGSGLGGNDLAFRTWPTDAALFLYRHGFLNRSSATTKP
jgi:acetyl esterase/lipase